MNQDHDESHGLRCFEPANISVPPQRGTRVICLCGWSAVAIHREPGEDVSRLTRALLKAHVEPVDDDVESDLGR